MEWLSGGVCYRNVLQAVLTAFLANHIHKRVLTCSTPGNGLLPFSLPSRAQFLMHSLLFFSRTLLPRCPMAMTRNQLEFPCLAPW